MSPQERDEELLQEYLKGDSALSRLYRRNADEQPDAQLDARILAVARRAVARKSRVAHSPFARHWMVPTSLAAVLVLSVGVVLLMPEPALEPALEPGVEPGVERGVERDRGAQPALAPAAVNAPQPAETVRLREAGSDPEEGVASGRASDMLRRQSPAMDQRAQQAVGKPGEKRKAVAAERKSATSDEAQSLPAAPAASVAERAAAPAAVKSLPEPVPGPQPMPADAVQASPAAWLRFIESLLNEQNREAAKSNLRAFRTRYPDFPLPAALMPLAASLDAERP